MFDQHIMTHEDATELAGRIIDRHVRAIPDLNVNMFTETGGGLFIRHANSDTGIPLITSCSGKGWRDQAVATLADILWQKRDCWNENHPEAA